MRKAIAALALSAALVTGGLVAGTPEPANAVYGASVKNVGSTGYVKIRMDDGTVKNIAPGTIVWHYVWGVYVPAGGCTWIGLKKYCASFFESSYWVILQAGQYTIKKG